MYVYMYVYSNKICPLHPKISAYSSIKIQNNIVQQKYNIYKTHQIINIKKYNIVYVFLIFFLSLKYRLYIKGI